MIRLSRSGDEAALRTLWQVAFGDPADAIDAFFRTLYVPGSAIVREEDGGIASAIYLLDAGYTPAVDGTQLRTSYAYALATLPAYRGRGIGSDVTSACIAYSSADGYDLNVICPAEESLFPYYTRLGYDGVFLIAEGEILSAQSVQHPFTNNIMSTNFSTYSQLRRALSPDCATLYSEPYLRYAELVCNSSGGGLYRLELNGQTACAAVDRRDADQLFIREFLPASLSEIGIPALCTHLSAASAIARTSADKAPPPLQRRPFALFARSGTQTPLPSGGYFPFVLD